jgi:hypothetical protein
LKRVADSACRRFSLQYNEMKVIVKLANIQLTPENPKYPEEHGILRELIGKISMPRYSIVTTLRTFLTQGCLSEHLLMNQSTSKTDDIGLRIVFGLEDEDLLFKDLGSVLAKENNILVFPNVMQRRVEPFELLDPTKPGHHKIL